MSMIAEKIRFDNEKMSITLDSGQMIDLPLEYFPKLSNASKEMLGSYELWDNGKWIHWEGLNEDMSVEEMINDAIKGTAVYSLSFCLEEEIVQQVAGLKRKLYDIIGWYPSCNSKAHITLDEFEADNISLPLRKQFIHSFIQKEGTQQLLTFDTFKYFEESRTIYLAPNAETQNWLETFAASYFKRIYHKKKPFTPHITIGRKIDPVDFEKAKDVFSKIETKIIFTNDSVSLRKFNRNIKQYDIIERFSFSSPY